MPETPRKPFHRIGLVAVTLMVLGPLLAWLRVVPSLLGFAVYALGGITAIVVTFLAIVLAARGRGLSRGGIAAIVGAIVFAVVLSRGGEAPRINDFTTDPADPPAFRNAPTLGPNAGRDMSYPQAYAAIQHQCCPDLQPAHLRLPPDQAFVRVRQTAETMPTWTITVADPAAGTLEAVATTRLFGFQDDIVIRLRPENDGMTRVDMRSKSRDGKGDLGTNAARIRAFVTTLGGAGRPAG